MPFQVSGTKKGGMPVTVEKRPKGKVATVNSNVKGDKDELLAMVKAAVGAGGSIAGHDRVEIQGDHAAKIQSLLLRHQDRTGCGPTMKGVAGLKPKPEKPKPEEEESRARREEKVRSAEVLAQHYDLVHGSAEVPADVIAQLRSRKQQIAAVELFGVLAPYLSVPDMLRGRRVIHWIDNTSAVAASTKGYSKAPDSARIVHALHMRIASIRARVWFEYVRTKANVADEPSRVDLSSVAYAFGDAMASVLGERLCSRPVPAVLPDASRWDEEGAAWMWRDHGRAARVCVRGAGRESGDVSSEQCCRLQLRAAGVRLPASLSSTPARRGPSSSRVCGVFVLSRLP